MRPRTRQVVLLALLIAVMKGHAQAPADGGWTQFRGPNATGIAAGTASIPVEFGPSQNRLWRTVLSSGHSSPVIWADRIFVTGFDRERKTLEVIGMNRTTGAIIWRRDVPVKQLEPVHEVSSPATATPVVDGVRLYVYFASYGLLAYDLDGKPIWELPLPHVEVPQGSGTSPILAGEFIVLNRHAPTDSVLMAIDRRTGTIRWQTPHEFPAGLTVPRASYSTPVVAGHQLVVHGPGRIDAYDVGTADSARVVVGPKYSRNGA